MIYIYIVIFWVDESTASVRLADWAYYLSEYDGVRSVKIDWTRFVVDKIKKTSPG